MDRFTGKPDHIEDYLVTVRSGQWFGWTDSKNKIYANLKVLDGGSKPTESEVNAGLTTMQDVWDEENKRFYYVNKKTGAVDWEKPKVLKNDDVDPTPRSRALAEAAGVDVGGGEEGGGAPRGGAVEACSGEGGEARHESVAGVGSEGSVE